MVGVLVPVAAFAQSVPPANFGQLVKTLRQGTRGDDVSVVQALLAADPTVYPEAVISGYFGPLTAAAVRRFQQKHGFEQVGQVGPKTLKKLQEMLADNPIAFEASVATGTTTGSATTTPPLPSPTNQPPQNPGIGQGVGQAKRPCAIVPPGHLIAPGWLKKNNGVQPVVPPCQTLPPGIEKKLNLPPTPTTTPTTTPPVTDTTAPTISAISVASLASTSATVAWTTNENATGKVYFSTVLFTDLNTASSVGTTTLSMTHSLGLSGLLASTTYYYVLESKDTANNTATSTTQTLVTLQ